MNLRTLVFVITAQLTPLESRKIFNPELVRKVIFIMDISIGMETLTGTCS